jgi:hypothetical protein
MSDTATSTSALGRRFVEALAIKDAEALDAFADREQVHCRFRGSNRDGPMVVEQQAHLIGMNCRSSRMSCSFTQPTSFMASSASGLARWQAEVVWTIPSRRRLT